MKMKKSQLREIIREEIIQTLTEEQVMDMTMAEKLKNRLTKELDVPFVQATISTLGGQHRPSVMLKISLDPKSDWKNGIYQNSNYSQFGINADGTIEQFSCWGMKKKFRKARFKTVDDAVKKINKYLKEVK